VGVLAGSTIPRKASLVRGAPTFNRAWSVQLAADEAELDVLRVLFDDRDVPGKQVAASPAERTSSCPRA